MADALRNRDGKGSRRGRTMGAGASSRSRCRARGRPKRFVGRPGTGRMTQSISGPCGPSSSSTSPRNSCFPPARHAAFVRDRARLDAGGQQLAFEPMISPLGRCRRAARKATIGGVLAAICTARADQGGERSATILSGGGGGCRDAASYSRRRARGEDVNRATTCGKLRAGSWGITLRR